MAAVTICSDFRAQKHSLSLFPLFPHLFPMEWWDRMPWSLFSECWALSQLFHSPLSLFTRASLVAQRLKCLPGMWETRVRSLGREDPLEKEMATYSSTLAWRIPWREEPGRLQSMGSQRVRHDWATSLHFILPRSKLLLISWLQSPSVLILEPKKTKSDSFHIFPICLPWSDRTGYYDLSFLNVEF